VSMSTAYPANCKILKFKVKLATKKRFFQLRQIFPPNHV
jgi:hypothetical protein